MEMIAQIISLIAMLINILSFQCKRTRDLCLMQAAGGFMFAISYFMLGSNVSAAFNLINILRSAVGANERLHTAKYFVLLSLAYVVATLFAFDSWWSFALMATQIVGNYMVLFGDGKFIRKVQFFVICPMWLINNSPLVVFSVGGILCEVITMVSIIVSFIRYRKTGFAK